MLCRFHDNGYAQRKIDLNLRNANPGGCNFCFLHVSATFLIEKYAYFTDMVGTLILVLKRFHRLQANLKTVKN